MYIGCPRQARSALRREICRRLRDGRQIGCSRSNGFLGTQSSSRIAPLFERLSVLGPARAMAQHGLVALALCQMRALCGRAGRSCRKGTWALDQADPPHRLAPRPVTGAAIRRGKFLPVLRVAWQRDPGKANISLRNGVNLAAEPPDCRYQRGARPAARLPQPGWQAQTGLFQLS